MERKRYRILRSWRLIGFALAITLTGWFTMGALATEGATKTSGRTAQASGSDRDNKVVMDKLDQILENQEKILKRFDEVMEELRIIKIRATLK